MQGDIKEVVYALGKVERKLDSVLRGIILLLDEKVAVGERKKGMALGSLPGKEEALYDDDPTSAPDDSDERGGRAGEDTDRGWDDDNPGGNDAVRGEDWRTWEDADSVGEPVAAGDEDAGVDIHEPGQERG